MVLLLPQLGDFDSLEYAQALVPLDVVLEAEVQIASSDIGYVKPGDEVLVHGKPIVVPYGETTAERRKATIKRAGWIERKWVKMTGDLEFMELLEFSFSGEEL